MNLTLKILLLVFFLNCFLSCGEQTKSTFEKPPTITLSAIGKEVSELDTQIWSVFQDSNGAYWFGSNGKGIYHFDGKILKQYTTEDGLSENSIRGIQEDKAGNIYIETSLGVNKYDGNSFATLKVLESGESKWRLKPDDLWFNCNSNNLYRYDGEWLHELKLPEKALMFFGMDNRGLSFPGMNNSPYAVYGIDKDKDGNIWFGTITAGAYRYDGSSFLWFGEKELTTLPDGRVPGVRSIIEDKDGYFWLSNFYSKYQIDSTQQNGYKKLKAVELPEEITKDKILYFNAGLSDKEGNLWMTTYGGGVWKYDGKTLTNQELNNGSEDVLLISIYQDNNGTIWLGTNNDGVYRQNGDDFKKFIPNFK